ncbi:hypothetical protein [Streptomyces sp. x-80]|uniref:hypothetical protein n=1 Tax=Streptomyces sp. x-80 TaxID=2789282 RepID=UPI00398051C3
MLPLFLTDAVELVDYARARASLKIFYERGQLQWILDNAKAGDYTLISLGRTETRLTPGLHTEPFGDHQEYLRAYTSELREHQVHPVLFTPSEARHLDGHHNNRRSLEQYPAAMENIAQETFTLLIDLYGQSLQWWNELGPEETKEPFTHLKPGEDPSVGISHASLPRPGITAEEQVKFKGTAPTRRGINQAQLQIKGPDFDSAKYTLAATSMPPNSPYTDSTEVTFFTQ